MRFDNGLFHDVPAASRKVSAIVADYSISVSVCSCDASGRRIHPNSSMLLSSFRIDKVTISISVTPCGACLLSVPDDGTVPGQYG